MRRALTGMRTSTECLGGEVVLPRHLIKDTGEPVPKACPLPSYCRRVGIHLPSKTALPKLMKKKLWRRGVQSFFAF